MNGNEVPVVRGLVRAWAHHVLGPPPPPRDPDAVDTEAVRLAEAFLDQARDVARWDRNRIDGFERKAGVILSASLVAFALLPNLLRPVSQLNQSKAFLLMLSVAAVCLAFAALFSGLCMAVKRSTYVSVDQLREEWEAITTEQQGIAPSDLRPEGALALTVQAMLVRAEQQQPKKKGLRRWRDRNAHMPVLDALRLVAEYKARWYSKAVVASSVAVGLTGTVVIVILVDGVLNG